MCEVSEASLGRESSDTGFIVYVCVCGCLIGKVVVVVVEVVVPCKQ